MQTYDTVANKPFKVGLKAAFRDFLHFQYSAFKRLFADVNTRGQWDPKVTMGALKEEITGFVAVGMDAFKTPAMKLCISEAFARDSRLAMIRRLVASEIRLKVRSRPINFHQDRNSRTRTMQDVKNPMEILPDVLTALGIVFSKCVNVVVKLLTSLPGDPQ